MGHVTLSFLVLFFLFSLFFFFFLLFLVCGSKCPEF